MMERGHSTTDSGRATMPAALPSDGSDQSWALAKLVPPLSAIQRQVLLLAGDAVLVAAAFYLAFWIRFEGRIPPERLAQFRDYLPLLLVIRLGLHLVVGVQRWSFRLSGFHEAVRLVETTLLGSLGFVTCFYFLQRRANDFSLGPPRSVLVLEFFLTASAIGALRFWPRLAHTWSMRAERTHADEPRRALIVGAGSAGELLVRDLHRSAEHSFHVLGFVDDDPLKWGISIGGRPVLGALRDLPALIRRWRVAELLFAIPRLPAERVREVLAACADLRLRYKILPVSYAFLRDRTALLHDLAPEDLLPRHEVQFEGAEIRAELAERRVLVTGAAGSIGREICRQVAGHDPARLVLVDQDENGLYLLYRQLQQAHPGLEMEPEVADVRDPVRLRELGQRHRPQDIFHAAAHKHVPLMERAPEEAIKTNVSGTRHVLEMAEAAGCQRFVLVSTDKAVEPASAMGASKRLAELLVRSRSREGRGPTFFTAVRFGNVLGSAGSVVPLFKAQIAAGGPVTVTDPGCRRYLMTIAEAVGLVLRAGLGGYGDLCILEMGEPFPIVDLARLMITLAGKVPEKEIPIVFTGLRPGDKLDERLLTEEEATASVPARPMVRAVTLPRPATEVLARIEALEAGAARGERAAVVTALEELFPSYREARATRLPEPWEEPALSTS